MKKIFVALLIVSLIASVSLAAVKKTTKKPAPPAPPTYSKPAASAAQPVKSSGFVISPKLGLGTGGLGALFLGCEVAYPIMQSVDVMGEVEYYMVSGGSIITVAGNGVYHFAPIAGAPGNFYAGGGLLYQTISSGGSFSAIGFQGFGGMDYQLPGAGTVFGQVKYAIANYTIPGVTIGGVTVGGGSVSSGGFVLEGGYRFYL